VKKISILLLLLTVVISTGCPRNAPKLDLSNNNHRELLIGQLKTNVYKVEWAEYKCASDGRYLTGLNNNNTGFSTFACTPVTQSSQDAKRIRNEVLDNGVGLIDSAYGIYIRNIRKNRSVGEFLADLLQIGGSVAAGITKGERPLQIIGVALTGYGAVRKSANLNFYDEKTTGVLIKQMDASRSQILSEIKQSQAKSTADYSFDAALDDIVRYFDAGTLNRAFTELDKQTSVDAEIARQGVLRIKKLDIQPLLPTEVGATVTKIDDKLTALENDLASGDNNKITSAGAFLKSVYDKINAESKFADIIKNLKEVANNRAQDNTLTATRKTKLKSAFDKIDSNQALSGEDYYALVSETFAKAVRSPELTALMQKIFTETKQ
jgi:hypothetical protein